MPDRPDPDELRIVADTCQLEGALSCSEIGIRRGGRINFNDDGTVDEIVLGPGAWLHVEDMGQDSRGYQDWNVIVGDIMLAVRVSPKGRSINAFVVEQRHDPTASHQGTR